MLFKLENLIKKFNLSNKNTINNIIQNDELCLSYETIDEISSLNNFYKELCDIFDESLKRIMMKITSIKSIKNKMLNENKIIENKQSTYKDLFWEIESMIPFFDINFDKSNNLVMPYNLEYHYDKLLFSYLFSCFDKISCILYFHISGENYNENKISDIKFNKLETYMKDDIPHKLGKIKDFIEEIIKSESFKYIKSSRNNIEHHHMIPWLKCNFNCDAMICAILVFELVLNIHNSM